MKPWSMNSMAWLVSKKTWLALSHSLKRDLSIITTSCQAWSNEKTRWRGCKRSCPNLACMIRIGSHNAQTVFVTINFLRPSWRHLTSTILSLQISNSFLPKKSPARKTWIKKQMSFRDCLSNRTNLMPYNDRSITYSRKKMIANYRRPY